MLSVEEARAKVIEVVTARAGKCPLKTETVEFARDPVAARWDAFSPKTSSPTAITLPLTAPFAMALPCAPPMPRSRARSSS